MKIARSELAALLSPAAQEAAVAPAAPDDSASNRKNAEAIPSLGTVLRRVAPGLWAKVDAAQLTRAEQRLRLLELVVWFAGKQGWAARENVAQRYCADGRTIAGRMHLELAHNDHTLRLEILFEPSPASLEKLRAAHQAGHAVAVIALFGMDFKASLEALQRQAGTALPWLTVIVPNG